MATALDALAALPPWDAAGYFQIVAEKFLNNAQDKDQICAADPNRVALVVGCTQAGGAAITMNPGGATQHGLQISINQPPLVLLFKDVGPLVQQAWFMSLGFGGANVTVYEIKLAVWPRAGIKKIGG